MAVSGNHRRTSLYYCNIYIFHDYTFFGLFVCFFTSQAKLPNPYELDVIRKGLGEVISPTSVVLLQELERYNKLIKKMVTSLNSLQKVRIQYSITEPLMICHLLPFFQALAGEVGMSAELDEVARSLYNGQIPSIWRALAPATLKSLGNWIIHFLKRNEQYSKWVG